MYIQLSIFLYIYLSFYPSIYLCIYLSLSIYPSIFLFFYSSIYPIVSMHLFLHYVTMWTQKQILLLYLIINIHAINFVPSSLLI